MTLTEAFSSPEDCAIALTEAAIAPGLSSKDRAYRVYARDFGTLMSRALGTDDAEQITGMVSALIDTVAITAGNLMIRMPPEDGAAFLASIVESMVTKLETHPKLIAEAATKHLQEAPHG